ncbi:MAG: hypothetical protein IKT73_09440, partial [Anaerotignum sp.]|nr:hypothetical protein [Anaerotignum sp.]
GQTINQPALSLILKEIVKCLFEDWTLYKYKNRRGTESTMSGQHPWQFSGASGKIPTGAGGTGRNGYPDPRGDRPYP